MSKTRRRTSRRGIARNRRRSAHKRRSVSRRLFPERLENRLLLAADMMFPWHNMFVATDVSGDLATTPLDALLIINELNTNGITALDSTADFGGNRSSKVFYDTVPDNLVTPMDALKVINALNNRAEGEGPNKRASFQLEATDTEGNALPIKDGMPQVVAGQDFELTMTVQDLRPAEDGTLVDGEFATGLFTAYADIAYNDPSLFEVIIEQDETFRDAFETSNVYNIVKEAHDWTENYDEEAIPTENEFDEVGATLNFQHVLPPDYGGSGGPDLDGDGVADPHEIFPVISVQLATLGTGTLTFQTNHHEHPGLAIHFLYGPEGAPEEPAELIDYGMLQVDIVDWVNAIDDSFPIAPDEILEDTSATLDVLANDFLAEASTGTLALSTVSQPSEGTASIVDGQVKYTPNPDFFGTDTFTYTAVDGDGNSNEATVTVTVTNVNDPPVANDDEFNIQEDSGANLLPVLNNDLAGPLGLETEPITLLSVTTLPTNGTATVSGNQIEYTPIDDFFGTDTLTYTIEDAAGLTDTATVTINVENVNDPPVALDDVYDIDEDTGPHDLNVLANDEPGPSGFETEAIAIDEIAEAPLNGTATISGDVIQYTPDPDFFGTDTFRYTISDVEGLTDTATVTVNVANINDPPIAADDILFVDELTTGNVLDVLANDEAGPKGEPETIRIIDVTTPDNGGTVAIADGGSSLVYSPEADRLGPFTETFEYTMEDEFGLTDTATVSIAVEPVVRPRARDDSFEVLEDSDLTDNVFDVTENDLFNDDAQKLPIVIGDGDNNLLQPMHGTLEVDGDFSVRYEPDPDFFGVDTFEYQIDDDFVDPDDNPSQPDIGRVTITVVNVNDPPVANDDTVTGIQEDSVDNVINVLLNDHPGPNEEEVDTITVVSIEEQAENGVAEVVDGQVLYTPNANYFGTDSFTYEITDSEGSTDTATVNLTVDNVNDAPVANDDTVTGILEDSTDNVMDVLANDHPGPNEQAVDSISVLRIEDPAENGEAKVVDGQVLYTPNPDYFGTDSFTYSITDDAGLTDTATVNLTIDNVNDPPVANDDEFNIDEDSDTRDLAVLNNDHPGPNEADIDSITLSGITVSPDNGTATISGDTIQYTPNPNFFGVDTFTYEISDSENATDTATVTINVTNINDAPIAMDDVLFVDEFTTDNVLDVLDNDVAGPGGESEAIEIIGVTQPATGGTVVIADDGLSLVYTPEADRLGPFTETFEYTMEDEFGLTDTATVSVTVEPVVRPRARDDSFEVLEDSDLTDNVFDVTENDLFNDDAQKLPIVIGDGDNSLLQPTHGTLEVLGDFSVRYEPDPDFFGVDTFEYQIDDDFVDPDDNPSQPDIGRVTITVVNVNDPPVANDDTVTGIQEDSVDNVINVLQNDHPGPNEEEVDTITVVSIGEQAENGVAEVVDGQVLYTPDANYFGTDSFTYKIADSEGSTDTATVNLTVDNVNDAPVANDDTVTGILEDSTDNVIDVLANDHPGPNEQAVDSISVLRIEAPAENGVAKVVDGQVLYTPDPDYFGTDSFTYSITDDAGLTDTATVNLTIDNVNDPPTAVPDVGDDQLLALKDFVDQPLDVLANDTIEPDINEELTIVGLGPADAQSITTAQGGTLTIIEDGKFVSYTPEAGFTGVDTFSYKIADGNGGFDSANAEIDVVDAVPSTISGSVFMDVNANGVKDAGEIGLSGVEITLTGTNIRGVEVNQTVKTDSQGVFTFSDILPNAIDDLIGYQISEKTPNFVTDGDEFIVDTTSDEDLDPGQAFNDLFTGIRPGLFGSNGRTEMNYHFGERGLNSQYVSIGQYLASSDPGIALATNMAGDDYWFTVLKGWDGIQSAHVQLADNLETAQLTITDSQGNEQTRELSYRSYRLVGSQDDGEYIIYINGSAADYGFDLAQAEGQAEGEAPIEGQSVDRLASRGAREFADNVDKIFSQGDWA